MKKQNSELAKNVRQKEVHAVAEVLNFRMPLAFAITSQSIR